MNHPQGRIALGSVLACLFPVTVSGPALAAGPQRFKLVENGDMETLGNDGMPVGWSRTSLKDAKGAFSVDTRVAHSGKHSLGIEKSARQGHCVWRSATIPINIDRETEADLSVWIKAEDSPWIMVKVITRDARGEFHQYLTALSIERGGFFDWTLFKKALKLKPGGSRLSVHQAGRKPIERASRSAPHGHGLV